MNGIIIINKEKGVSSNKVVSIVKKQLNVKKVGHLGTLDPLACGVLPVCVGKATRLFDYFLNKTKTYIAEFTFGKTTDTLDLEGKVIEENGKIPTIEEVKVNANKLTGKLEQMPPKYSAKSVNGVRAYNLARNNVDFELKPKQIEVFKFEMLRQISNDTFEFLIDCSSGTYIRSLARDLGTLCDSCAFMSKLTRTRCGDFNIDDAISVENIEDDKIIPIEKVLNKLKRVDVNENDYDKLRNGVKVYIDSEDKKDVLVYSRNELFGIGYIENNLVRINTYLHD